MGKIVLVRSFEVRQTRKGDNFGTLRVNLGQSGSFAEVDAKIWGLDGMLYMNRALPAAGDMIEVDYRADEYQGKPQWVINSWEVLGPEAKERVMADFRPPERIDRAFYRDRLETLIEATSPERTPGILLRQVFDRAGFREDFFHLPAAYRHHQNYPGGLLEHTLNVTTLALTLADAYAAPGRTGLTFNRACLPIDRDVLIAAGLLHDIGKMLTYRFDPMPEVNEINAWEGHLAISYAQVRQIAQPMLDQPPYAEAVDEIEKLLHCILSHHGSLEFGSPVVPACAEAFILSQADMTDARLAEIAEAGAEALGRTPGTRWLTRNLQFPGGIFIGDWPRPDAAEPDGDAH